VALESEAVFEGPEDALDALADPSQRRAAVRFVLAGRSKDRRAEVFLGVGLEVAAGVALVAYDHLAAVQAPFEQAQRDAAFLLVG
jgi:hypothetical protein